MSAKLCYADRILFIRDQTGQPFGDPEALLRK